MDKSSPTAELADAVAAFLAEREAHCSPATMRWYAFMLRPLITHFTDHPLAQVTADDLRAYMLAQRQRVKPDGQSISSRTINDEMRSARTFFHYCQTEGLIHSDPSRALRSVRTDRRRQPLTFEQVETILECLRRGTWKMHERDFALFLLLYDTACRREELCRLRIEDLNLEQGFADVIGKGDKSRRVGLLSLTVGVLRSYLGERYRGPVFLNDEGKALRAQGIRQIFERLSERTHIHVYPHLMRHTSATHFILNTGDVADLQILMGHSQITTTVGYIEAARAVRALEAHREHSPVNRLKPEEAEERAVELPRLRRVK